MKKDFLSNKIKVGDYVAFARNPYSDLKLGKVIGFTPKGFRIKRKLSDGNWVGKKPDGTELYEVILPYQCVKIQYSEEVTNE